MEILFQNYLKYMFEILGISNKSMFVMTETIAWL